MYRINPMIDEDPYNDGPADTEIAAQERYECEKDDIQYKKALKKVAQEREVEVC